MIHTKRFTPLLVCLASLMLLTPSCTCTTDSELLEPTTITFAYNVDTRADPTEYYESAIEMFNQEHPNITIELQPTPYNQGYLASADTFISSAFYLRALWDNGQILSLDPLIAQDTGFDYNDFHPGMAANLTTAEETFGLPSGANIDVMFYNKEVFDLYNVPYPEIDWTWDDFLATGQALTHLDDDVFGFIPIDTFFEPILFMYQHGGGIFDDIENPTVPTFDRPANIEALAWYIDLFYEHNIAPTGDQAQSAFGSRDNYAPLAIVQNQAGMWIATLSSRGGVGWPSRWNIDWGVVPLPSDELESTMIFVDGYAISANTLDPEASWVWISFLSEQDTPYLNATPARLSVLESDTYANSVEDEVYETTLAALQNGLFFSLDVMNFGEELDILGQAIYSTSSGTITAEAALTEAQRNVEALQAD